MQAVENMIAPYILKVAADEDLVKSLSTGKDIYRDAYTDRLVVSKDMYLVVKKLGILDNVNADLNLKSYVDVMVMSAVTLYYADVCNYLTDSNGTDFDKMKKVWDTTQEFFFTEKGKELYLKFGKILTAVFK